MSTPVRFATFLNTIKNNLQLVGNTLIGAAPDGSNEAFSFDANRMVNFTKLSVASRLYASLVNDTVVNTLTGSLMGTATAIGSNVLPANFLVSGMVLRLSGRGFFSTKSMGGAGDLNAELTLNGTPVVTSPVNLVPNNIVNEGWEVEILFTVRSIGGAGTMSIQGNFRRHSAVGTYNNGAFITIAPTVVDTTSPLTIDLNAIWDPVDPLNSITSTNMLIELLN